MNNTYENDFLDELRLLNKDNINKDGNKRDAFFDKLMVIGNDAPDYLSHLSSAYATRFDKQYQDNIAKDYILLNIFGTQIQNQLQDNLIEDRINDLCIDGNGGAYAVTYIGSIKGMRTLIESSSKYFESLKKSILIGLITRYSMELQNSNKRNIERLNKLVVMYIEQNMNIEMSRDIPMVIDDEFIKEILSNKNNISLNKTHLSVMATHNLIGGKYCNDRKYSNSKNYYLESNGYYR